MTNPQASEADSETAEERPAIEHGAATAQAPAPRQSGQRLVELDAIRGFALLGIVLVNVDFFALPIGLMEAGGPYEPGPLPLAAWVFVALFCTGKFYPLFSLLFGMGISLQRGNVLERGGRYVSLGLRRMAILALFGIAHIVLLWYGDILVFYATAGMAAVLLSGVSWRWRSIGGVVLIAGSALSFALIAVLLPGEDIDVFSMREAIAQQEVGERPFMEMIERIDRLDDDVTDPFFLAAEAKAHRDGGFLQALGFRLFTFATLAAVGFVGLWWAVLGLFLLGGALFEWGVLQPGRERALMSMIGLAMVVGLPASALTVVGMQRGGLGAVGEALVFGGPMLFGPIMALGYFAAIVLLVRFGLFGALTTSLAFAGRMALTNYLMQSLVLAFVFHHWGLRQFGQISGDRRVVLVAALFAAQVAFSKWWLARYRFGPLEWLWRVLTYGARQPMRRTRHSIGP